MLTALHCRVRLDTLNADSCVLSCPFFFCINLQPLKKWSTTRFAPFALDSESGSLTDILSCPSGVGGPCVGSLRDTQC